MFFNVWKLLKTFRSVEVGDGSFTSLWRLSQFAETNAQVLNKPARVPVGPTD